MQRNTVVSRNEYRKSHWTFWFLCVSTLNNLRCMMVSRGMGEFTSKCQLFMHAYASLGETVHSLRCHSNFVEESLPKHLALLPVQWNFSLRDRKKTETHFRLGIMSYHNLTNNHKLKYPKSRFGRFLFGIFFFFCKNSLVFRKKKIGFWTLKK